MGRRSLRWGRGPVRAGLVVVLAALALGPAAAEEAAGDAGAGVGAAPAADSPLLAAWVGWTRSGGAAEQPGWLFVGVELEQAGGVERAFEVVVEATVGAGARWATCAPVALTPGQRRRLEVPLAWPGGLGEVAVSVRDAGGGAPLERRTLRVPLGEERVAVVVRGRAELQDTWWRELAAGPVVAAIAQDLPRAAAGYGGLDALALWEADLDALDAAQMAALRAWLHEGGRVVVVPGRNATWLASPALARALGEPAPLTPTRVTTRDLPELSSHLGALQRPRPRTFADDVLPDIERPPFAVWRFSPPGPAPDARALDIDAVRFGARGRRSGWGLTSNVPVTVTPDGGAPLPLVERRPRGRGWVDLLAVDVGRAPFDRWPGRRRLLAEFLERDLSGAASAPAARLPDAEAGRAAGRLLAPDLRPLTWFVLAYLALAGPAQVLLLRRLDRPLLALLSVPALAAVATGVLLVGARTGPGARAQVLRASVLEVELGAVFAQQRCTWTLLSHAPARVDVRLGPGLLGVGPLGAGGLPGAFEARWEMGGMTFAHTPRPWHRATWAAEGPVELPGPVRLVPAADGGHALADATGLALGPVLVADDAGGLLLGAGGSGAAPLRPVPGRAWSSDALAQLGLSARELQVAAPFLLGPAGAEACAIGRLTAPTLPIEVHGPADVATDVHLLLVRRPAPAPRRP